MLTRKLLAAAAIAVAVPVAPVAAAETLTATFTTPDGGVTAQSYSGTVLITVSGTGFSNGTKINDAFYDVDSMTHDANFYQLTFGTAPLVPLDPAQDAVNFIPGGLPAYEASHVYTFLLDTGAVVPTMLHFGVSDGQFGDNGGAYTITVASVPEAGTWAMMIGGLALVGTALRRRSGAVAA